MVNISQKIEQVAIAEKKCAVALKAEFEVAFDEIVAWRDRIDEPKDYTELFADLQALSSMFEKILRSLRETFDAPIDFDHKTKTYTLVNYDFKKFILDSF